MVKQMQHSEANLKIIAHSSTYIFNICYSIVMKYVNLNGHYRWLDKLGVSAKEGMGAVMRQTFCGGNYALTDENNMPNSVSTMIIFWLL